MIIRGGETKNDRMGRRIGEMGQKHGRDIAERICQDMSSGKKKEDSGKKAGR